MAMTRRSARLGGCVIVATVAAAGCSSGQQHDPSPGHSERAVSASPTTATPGATSDPYAPSVGKAPKLASEGITTLVTDTTVKGNSVYPIPGGIKAGKTLAIAVNCQGPGRLTVQVQPTGISFPLLCERGKVLPTMNEIHMSKNRSSSSLRFTAEPNVMWSFRVGWDPHPPEQQ